MSKTKGLLERLHDGEGVVVAEGYLFEFEARGYLKAGHYVPEVVLEKPELVRELHREFVHAGSDVVLAFTYYGHREKMRLIGREDEVVKLNRTALKIAREVADETGTLMAGNISNATIYKPDPEVEVKIFNMYKEQVEMAVEGGADFIVGETFHSYGEASLCLKAIKEFGKGLPAVITYTFLKGDLTADGMSIGEACLKLEQAGADVVGLNCGRGPATMLPFLKEIKDACKVPVAALPVLYRTDKEHPTFQSLCDIDDPNTTAFPVDLGAWLCSRKQVEKFTKEAWNLGIRYLGLCCGNRAHYTRTMAEAIGRKPPASRYSPDMSLHYSRMKDEAHSYTQSTFAERYKTN